MLVYYSPSGFTSVNQSIPRVSPFDTRIYKQMIPKES